MKILLLIFTFITVTNVLLGQCVTYKLNSKGDTLNCTDKKNLKQGKWVIHVDELRGNEGYEEEGVFENDKKEGVWRIYNLMGDLKGIENYYRGVKNGICQYYTIAGLEREESWKAIKKDNLFDTVDVYSLTNKGTIEKKIVQVDFVTYKDGIWKYYRPGSMSIIRTETYFLDKLQKPTSEEYNTEKKPTPTASKPKEVIEFEKKVESKKGSKIRTGRVGY